VTWDGRILRGGALVDAPEGRNVLEITMRDLAGNDASVRRGVVVDRTLGFPTVSPSTISPNGDGARDSATVGFTLTRQANVTLAVLHGATVVRTVTAGTLAAGDRSLIWDGKLTGGEDAPNGDYQLRVTADGSIGVTSVSVGVKVDRYAPRLTVPGTASVALGQTAGITYSVRDPYSAKVKVTASIADANGVAAGTVACGWVPQGKSARCAWKPPARGSYTLTFTAVDRGGNAQSATEVTTLTVH